MIMHSDLQCNTLLTFKNSALKKKIAQKYPLSTIHLFQFFQHSFQNACLKINPQIILESCKK